MSSFKLGRGNVTYSGPAATLAPNLIYGNVGQDNITFNGTQVGTLQILGGTGKDTLTNAGTNVTNEYIYGGTFSSVINGGTVTGTENLYGHAGSDTITANGTIALSMNAYILGGVSGNDSLTANSAAAGSGGNDTIVGGTGKDTITVYDSTVIAAGATQHHHYLYGGTGAANIILTGVTAAGSLDYVIAGSGNDTVVGSTAGVDLINTGTGVDSITGVLANEANQTVTFMGEGGIAQGAGISGVTVNLGGATETATANWQNVAGGTVLHVNTSMSFIANVIGTNFNDSITGSVGSATLGNHIYTGAGNDTITLASANVGNDTITGGSGNKLYIINNGTQGNSGTSVGDQITGGQGNDTLDFSNVTAGAGVTLGSAGTIQFSTNDGYGVLSTVTGEFVNMSSTTNVYGVQGVNFAGYGGEGTITSISTIKGSLTGNNFMVGAGGETMVGGNGNDTLLGGYYGAGHDTLIQNSAAGKFTTFDGVQSIISNWFEVGNNTAVTTSAVVGSFGATEVIYGFSEFYGDKMYLKVSNSTASPSAISELTSLTNQASTGAANSSGDNGTYNWTYSAAGKLSTLAVDANAVVNGSNVGSATNIFAANTTAGKGDFVFDTGTGNLYWNATGGAAVSGTAYAGTLVEIAHIDLSSGIASGGAPLTTLSSADFILA